MKCIPGCIKCCLETEMLLTEDDIRRIESLGYKKHQFTEYKNGFYKLKNINGHCVFLDVKRKRCIIYKHRPIGCRVYPVIYDYEKGVILDSECPAINTISKEEFISKAKILLNLIKKLNISKIQP